MRIGVIKEVDEQMTVTSMQSDKRPHVQTIFPSGPPPPSAPVAVPGAEYSRNGELFSASAPVAGVAIDRDNEEGIGSTNDRRRYASESRYA